MPFKKLNFNFVITYLVINLILTKYVNIPFYYRMIISFIFTLLIFFVFFNMYLKSINFIKNTYFFNWLFYCFLILKDNMYRFLFYLSENTVEFFSYLNLQILFSIFNTVIFFFICILYNLFNYVIFLFLLFSIFNLLENHYVKYDGSKSFKNELKFSHIQQMLHIKNNSFQSNRTFNSLNKKISLNFTSRSIWNETMKAISKNTSNIIAWGGITCSSLTVGFTGISALSKENQLQHEENVKLQQEANNIAQKHLDISQKNLDIAEKKLDIQNLKINKECIEKQQELEFTLAAIQNDNKNILLDLFRTRSPSNKEKVIEKQLNEYNCDHLGLDNSIDTITSNTPPSSSSIIPSIMEFFFF